MENNVTENSNAEPLLSAGEYLAITGEKLNGVDMMVFGLATHYSLKEVSLSSPAQGL